MSNLDTCNMTFEIENIPYEETFLKKCIDVGIKPGLIRIKPSNCILSEFYEQYIDDIRNMPVRDNDVFVISNPKCGTTWCQEMTWLIGNDMDFEKAKVPLQSRFPYLDIAGLVPLQLQTLIGEPILEKLNNLDTQRFLKSHLPVELLPVGIWEKKVKIIFVVRDPKDAATSYFHFIQIFLKYEGTLDEFMDEFLDDKVAFSPFWEHAIAFWKMRNEPNVLFITYEEMKKDLEAVIHKVATHLGKKVSEEDVRLLKEHLSFETMKKNPSVNFFDLKETIENFLGVDLPDGAFMRQGKVGENDLSEETVRRFDEWTKRKLNGTGLDKLYC